MIIQLKSIESLNKNLANALPRSTVRDRSMLPRRCGHTFFCNKISTMKFSFGLFLALSAPAAALRAGSRVGSKLMKSAVRQLDQNNQDDQDAGWIADYSIVFDSCHMLVQVAEEGGNDEQGMIYNKNLVTFHLCPTETCGQHYKNCGKYVVGMEEFVDAWTEAKVSFCV